MDNEARIKELEKENKILKREYARLQQDLSMLSNLSCVVMLSRNRI